MQQTEDPNWIRYANLVTLCRVLLLPPTIYGIVRDIPLATLGGFTLIIASDFLDGALARRAARNNPLGTLLDHGADAFVVVALGVVFARLSYIPTLLPMIIAIAFAQYAFDAQKTSNKRPRPSGLGKANGIAYFVVSGLCIAVHHGNNWLPSALYELCRNLATVLAWVLICSTSVSIFQRAQLRGDCVK